MRHPDVKGATRARAVSVSRRAWIVATALAAAAIAASEPMPPRLYQVTTETVMPHLEENLRYAITHDERCVGQGDLATEFPILSHPALKDCALEHESRHDDVISYVLVCDGGHGTTGNASWELGEHHLTGTLNVKLGGKNMTFYQRITAIPEGACTHLHGP